MQMTNGNSVSRRMPPPDVSRLASLAGDYYSDELDATWTVAVKDGKVVVQRRALADWAMTPVFLDAFQMPAGVMRFERDGSGRVTGFVVGAGRVTGFKFSRKSS